MNEQDYLLGIDVGSTTVKVAIMDQVGEILYSEYRRHFARIQETLAEVLRRASEKLEAYRYCLPSPAAAVWHWPRP